MIGSKLRPSLRLSETLSLSLKSPYYNYLFLSLISPYYFSFSLCLHTYSHFVLLPVSLTLHPRTPPITWELLTHAANYVASYVPSVIPSRLIGGSFVLMAPRGCELYRVSLCSCRPWSLCSPAVQLMQLHSHFGRSDIVTKVRGSSGESSFSPSVHVHRAMAGVVVSRGED